MTLADQIREQRRLYAEAMVTHGDAHGNADAWLIAWSSSEDYFDGRRDAIRFRPIACNCVALYMAGYADGLLEALGVMS